MKKMDKRKRQHPLWIGYKFFQTLKFIFIPTSLLFIYYYETKASWTSIAWIGIILVITFQLIICIFQWKHHTYFITDTNLELCEGMFTRKKRNIPLNRIQRFEQFDTIFHRIFRLHSLHLIVESTYSKQSTIILPMVSQEDAKNVIRVFEISIHSLTISLASMERRILFIN